jgi:hypothetical protein
LGRRILDGRKTTASDPKTASTVPFFKDNDNRNYMTTAYEIIEACKAKDRAAIKRLIEAIPRDAWVVEPGLATVRLMPATVRVWHLSGGSGINTYTEVSVVVELEDLDLDGPVPPLYQGKFTDEELKIANYIPRDARPPAGKTV